MSRVSSEEFNKPDGQTGGGDSNKPEQEPFQEKVLGTSKLQDENKENSSPSAKPEFLRMQSQFAIPVVAKNEYVLLLPRGREFHIITLKWSRHILSTSNLSTTLQKLFIVGCFKRRHNLASDLKSEYALGCWTRTIMMSKYMLSYLFMMCGITV